MADGYGHPPDTADTLTLSTPAQKQCRVVVVGNEKGGAGKSTVSIHLAIALMRMGSKVGVIDLDVRQRTLTRYLENRMRWMQSTGAKLPMPEIIRVDASTERDLDVDNVGVDFIHSRREGGGGVGAAAGGPLLDGRDRSDKMKAQHQERPVRHNGPASRRTRERTSERYAAVGCVFGRGGAPAVRGARSDQSDREQSGSVQQPERDVRLLLAPFLLEQQKEAT